MRELKKLQFHHRRQMEDKLIKDGFDFYEICSQMEEFAFRHNINRKKVIHAERILEDLCMDIMFGEMGLENHIHFLCGRGKQCTCLQ